MSRPRVFVALVPLAALLVPALAAQTYGVAVTPQGTTIPNKTTHTTGYTYAFRVQNEGSTQQTWTLSCVGASNITCTNWPPSVTLAADAFQDVTVTFSTGNEGTGQLYLTASNAQSSDQGWINVPVVLPAGAPKMSVLPYLDAKQDYGRCAASCFAATYAQSTVPYVSLDAPRNVTLVYHGDRVAPKPFVLVDVRPDSSFGSWPSEYQLQVKVNGTLVTFLNGETTLRFGNPANLNYRIGGQFTPPSLTHGDVKPMEILVSAKIGVNFYQNRWITQYLHLDEALSAVARGWTLAGIQRAFIVGGTGILVTEGDGSATYFKYNPVTLKYDAPAGDFSTLTASGSNWVRAYPDSTKVTFNSSGQMVRVADRWGVRDTVLYTSGKVTQIKDHLNNPITLAYDANGLDYITDPFSRTTQVTVDASKRLTTIQDPDGFSTTFGYDASLRLKHITNRDGKADTLSYLVISSKETNKLASVKAPSIPVFGGGNANPVTTFDPWLTKGVPYASTSGTPLTPPKADTVYGRVTEPGGTQTTKFTVNRWGSPAVATDPLAQVTTIRYTVNGLPQAVVAPGYGAEKDTLAYNGSGLVTFRKAAGDASGTVITYGGWAQPTFIQRPGQDSTRFFLGGNGRVDSVKVGGQLVQKIPSYDTHGRPLTVVDGVGITIATYAYSATASHKNLQSVTAPGNRATSYTYDGVGRRITVTPPGSLPTETTYYTNSTNRVDSVKVATSPVTLTKLRYDKLGRDTMVTDPKNQVHRYAYNAVGWVTTYRDPANGVESYQYAVNGDLRRRVNRRSQSIDFTYDALHRLTARAGSASVGWSYTNNGYTITATSPTATETTTLNVRGQPTSISTVIAAKTFTRTYHYTGAGLLDTVSVTGPGITFQQRVYGYQTGKGILTSIKLGGQTTSFTVDGNFNPTGITFPAGDTRTITQGGLQTPVKVTTTAGYNSTIERWLGFTELGQVEWHLTYPNAEFGRKFAYDSLGRLRTGWPAVRPPGALPPGCPSIADGDGMSDQACPESQYQLGGPETVTYDAVGNRTDKGGAYNTGNRITSFDNCTYGTDAEGNVTSRTGGSCPAASFFWTAEGQLDSLHAGSTGVRFFYDADGRLVLKRVNQVAQAYFLWDGANLLAELNGTATAKVAEYSYYPGLDKLHALVVGTSRYYGHVDGLGNVIALTDESQVLQRTYQYTDWGVLNGGTDTKPFSGADRARWKGALWLGPEVELYYLRNRWYEPRTGRFLSEDPIGLQGGINPMVFAGNDPMNMMDPMGLQGCLHRGDCPPLRLPDIEVVVGPWPFGTSVDRGYTDRFGMPRGPGTGIGSQGEGDDRGPGGRGTGDSRGLWDRLWNAYPHGCLPTAGGCQPMVFAGVPDWITGPASASLLTGIAKAIKRAQGAEITWSRIGAFVRATWQVQGGKNGFVIWYRALTSEGKTVRLYKDVFNRYWQYIRRDPYVPPQ